MELRHLRYFAAVAETENVSRAALRLHLSQPALSRQIRDLEDELGFPLLTRTAKSVQLTAAGRTFLDEARAVLLRAEQAIKVARAVATGQRGELHIGYAPSPTVRILPPALRAFQEQGAQIVFMTARPEAYRAKTEGALRRLGLEPHAVVMDCRHGRRFLINDHAASNPYPSAVAISTERNSPTLAEYMKDWL